MRLQKTHGEERMMDVAVVVCAVVLFHPFKLTFTPSLSHEIGFVLLRGYFFAMLFSNVLPSSSFVVLS
eukprot:m.246095 g.246095  ORF g.246095 m.246095 type:complete len:68 (+) comp67523_c0_seq1:137-340(+)